MKAAVLTQRKLEAIKPGKMRVEYPDKLVPGLRFVIQPKPSGATSWIVRSRIHGKPFKLKLGDWQPGDQPLLSLSSARELAREAIIAAKAGEDPRGKREVVRNKVEAEIVNTLRHVCETYLAREGKKLRTFDQRRRMLTRLVYPTLGSRPIDTITRGELIRLEDEIEDKSGTRSADMVHAFLSKIMGWHALRHEDYRSPIVRGMKRGKPLETARTRILSDDELRRVWAATVEMQGPFPALVRFLLLTGARRGEASEMRFDELDDTGNWVLPASRNKTKLELLRPLSRAAQDVLATLPRFADCPYCFTYGRRPLTGFSAHKAVLDARSGVTGFVLHDLRRTARSLMSRASIHPDISERCLGHTIPGVRKVYDRYEFRVEKAAAYEALAGLIERIVNPQPNVLPMRGKVVASGEGA
jgi:integrase